MTKCVDAEALERLAQELEECTGEDCQFDGGYIPAQARAAKELRSLIATAKPMPPATETEVEALKWCVDMVQGHLLTQHNKERLPLARACLARLVEMRSNDPA